MFGKVAKAAADELLEVSLKGLERNEAFELVLPNGFSREASQCFGAAAGSRLMPLSLRVSGDSRDTRCWKCAYGVQPSDCQGGVTFDLAKGVMTATSHTCVFASTPR